jgi:polyisoprenoid-binding protein YceI
MRVFAALLLLSSWAQATTYKLDPAHTEIGFAVKHLMVSTVKGHFNKYDGKFNYDGAKKELKDIDVSIDASSVDTGQVKRDEHLQSDDFFSVKKFPKITFKSQKVDWAADGKTGKVSGLLTIRDKTKPVTLDIVNNGEVDFGGAKHLGFSATGKINRKDFGVSWNKAMDHGGVALSDDVTINIDGEANIDDGKTAKK